MIGIALSLIFAGGAAGKLACGWLGARFGVVRATFITEGPTAAGVLALLPLSLIACLPVLPVIGMALNGTSSVLYRTVPELVASAGRQRAFGIFYTGGVGAGALSLVLYGMAGDFADVPTLMVLVAAIVLVILLLAWRLGPHPPSVRLLLLTESGSGAKWSTEPLILPQSLTIVLSLSFVVQGSK